jgi:hypothetical protein
MGYLYNFFHVSEFPYPDGGYPSGWIWRVQMKLRQMFRYQVVVNGLILLFLCASMFFVDIAWYGYSEFLQYLWMYTAYFFILFNVIASFFCFLMMLLFLFFEKFDADRLAFCVENIVLYSFTSFPACLFIMYIFFAITLQWHDT